MADFHITINNKPFDVHEDQILVGRLKELGGVPASEELSLVLPDGFKPLEDGESIHLREGMKFLSSVRTGRSS